MSEMSMSELEGFADAQGEIPEVETPDANPNYTPEQLEALRQRFIAASTERWPHGEGGAPPEVEALLSELIAWIHGNAGPPNILPQWVELLDESHNSPRAAPLKGRTGLDQPLFGRHRNEVRYLRTRLAEDGEPPELKAERLAKQEAKEEELRSERAAKKAAKAALRREKLEFVPGSENRHRLTSLLEGTGNLSFQEFGLDKLTDSEYLDETLGEEERLLLHRVCHQSMKQITHKEEAYAEDGVVVEPDPSTLEQFNDEVVNALKRAHSNVGGIARFLADDGKALEPDWIVPGLIAHGDRWVITGNPGAGKSHLGMQICWDVARGVHPLTGESLTKRTKTMFVNLELNDSDVSAMFEKLDAKDPDVEIKVGDYAAGMEITDALDGQLAQLKNDVEVYQPDIIWLAGIYKMTAEDLGHKVGPVREIQRLVDYWRNELPSKPAVMLEAQKGHNDHRPKGGAEWKFWPEFGIHLGKDGTISEWRDARNDQRFVPDKLERVKGRWMLPQDIGKLCFDLIAAEGHMSNQVLGERLGVSKHTVGRNFSSEDKDQAVELHGQSD